MRALFRNLFDAQGRPVSSGITVAVKFKGTGTDVPLFSDDGVTAIGNPIAPDANGSITFWAPNCRLTMTPSGGTPTWGSNDYTDDAVFDPIVKASTTSVGTPANTTETDLISLTLPAYSLNPSMAPQVIRIRAHGTTAANANTKQARLKFGGTTILDSTALAASNKDWFMEATVYRSGASTQEIIAWGIFNGALIAPLRSSLAITESAAIIVKVTGQNGTASASDLVNRALSVTEPG